MYVAKNASRGEEPPRSQGTTSSPGPALIRVRNLLAQNRESFALRIPDLELWQGDMLVVLGPNGSGKSTLLSCLLGATTPTLGEITVLGSAPGRLPLSHRQSLGVQWQDAGFNELYLVREIQELHRRCYARSDASVFEAFGIPELATKRFGRLSSGEQQRVQLAMALAHHPQLTVFDEPTSNLDPHYEDIFCQLLETRSGTDPRFAAIFVTHSARVAALSRRVLLLGQGSIDEIAALDVLVDRLFGTAGCRVAAAPEQLADLETAFTSTDTIRRVHRSAGAIAAYGGSQLRQLAHDFASRHEVDHFSLWRPGAADLLEALKRA